MLFLPDFTFIELLHCGQFISQPFFDYNITNIWLSSNSTFIIKPLKSFLCTIKFYK